MRLPRLPGWTVADLPDLHGRVAVVTGAGGGLGLVTTLELARAGALVVMAVRRPARAAGARAEIEAAVPGAAVEVRECDLASLASVRGFAAALLADHPRLDLLVNNAGVMAVPEQVTADGLEMQFGVNHLGHFVLTHRLLPALLAAPAGRVVTVTSFARLTARGISAANPNLRGEYQPWRAYGQSKLANLLFALELDRRLVAAGAAVRSLSAHPGLARTDLQARSVRESGGWSQRFWLAAVRTVGMPADRGAWPVLRAATDRAARGGQLYGPALGIAGPPGHRPLLGGVRRPDAGAELWRVSERETGEAFDVAAAVRDARRP